MVAEVRRSGGGGRILAINTRHGHGAAAGGCVVMVGVRLEFGEGDEAVVLIDKWLIHDIQCRTTDGGWL